MIRLHCLGKNTMDQWINPQPVSTGIPHGRWLMPKLLHFPSASLLVVWAMVAKWRGNQVDERPFFLSLLHSINLICFPNKNKWISKKKKITALWLTMFNTQHIAKFTEVLYNYYAYNEYAKIWSPATLIKCLCSVYVWEPHSLLFSFSIFLYGSCPHPFLLVY